MSPLLIAYKNIGHILGGHREQPCYGGAHTSEVRKSLKDGCRDSPLSFFSSPPSHSGHKCVFLSNTHDLRELRPG